ncbi:alpha/beta fold hydrolase [Phenylobacterium sp.]|jgi:pimeloyl-ACP methyl ester carboxylesterase|uniref:alpha/beta fold hydrolase n=1 Tax=Phenylobacterium sp. TaxID=1871053 RepID=UPI002E3501AE|nr:alpha/beta fold hydrolase [Phenylobacterium sp.]HEX4710077.1 alpha/beta fold hydrolase [Phenylobacterium sp.]
MTTIVMVHGAFCGGWAFDCFRTPFEAAGFEVIAPNLRGHGPDERAEAVIGVSMADYAADIADLCAGLPQPPVLLGHSMGGLVAQLAARRAKVEALVLLAPSAPWGVAASSLEEAATAFGVQLAGAFSSGALQPDKSLMRAYSLDRVPPAEREAAVARLRPESALAVRETLNWWLDPFMTTSIGPGALDAASLVIAGEGDVVHSPRTARAVAERLGATFRSMPGMSHWLVGEPGWEGVARLALRWLAEEVSLAA